MAEWPSVDIGRLIACRAVSAYAPNGAVVTYPRPSRRSGRSLLFSRMKVEAMTQRELNRAVACATGESVSEIASRGFVELTEVPFEREDQYIDWDQIDLDRNTAVIPQPASSLLCEV